MSNREVIFFGSNPSNKAQSSTPFSLNTKSGQTLVEWVRRAKIRSVVFANVSNTPTLNNRSLSVKEIRAELPRIEKMLAKFKESNLPVVAVGKTAVLALTLLRADFYELPHPSGLNRKLNDPKYVEEKIKGLQEYLETPKV